MVECFAMTWRSSLLKERKDLCKAEEKIIRVRNTVIHIVITIDWEHRNIGMHTYSDWTQPHTHTNAPLERFSTTY